MKPVTPREFYETYWHPFRELLTRVEHTGWQVDPDYFVKQSLPAQEDLEAARARVTKFAADRGFADFNPASHPQLTELLYGERGCNLPVPPLTKKGRTKKGQLPTDAAPEGMPSALNYLIAKAPDDETREGVRSVVAWRRADVSLRYLKKLPRFATPAGRIHAVIGADADTGRLTVGKPPLQQIPRDKRKDRYKLRKGFIARPGKVLSVTDASQLEMRILGHLLIKLFKDDKLAQDVLSADCHSANALRVFGPLRPVLAGVKPEEVKNHPDPRVRQAREDIKAVAYGMNYGKGDLGIGYALLDEHGNPIGERAGHAVREAYLDLYPGLRWYMDWVREFVIENGGMMSLLGRWRELPGARGQRWEVDAAVRAALNQPMQGGGADIINLAMLILDRDPRRVKMGAELIMQVHDELAYEVDPEHCEEWTRIVEWAIGEAGRLLGLEVPIAASGHCGASWEEAK
jgi:DNA polymerase-1